MELLAASPPPKTQHHEHPRSRGRKLLLVVLSVASIGLAGGLGYMMFAKGKKGAETLEEAEKDYAAGLEAYTKGDGKSATDHFDRARLRSEKILQGLEKSDDPNVTKTPAPNFRASCITCASRIRDSYYAKARATKSRLPNRTTRQPTKNTGISTLFLKRTTSIRLWARSASPARNSRRTRKFSKTTCASELTLPGMQWDRVSTLCQQI